MYDEPFLNEYENLWSKAMSIPGFITKYEGLLLYLHAQSLADLGSIVEVGSFHGRSTMILGRGILRSQTQNCKLITIDNFVKQTSNSYPNMGNPKVNILRRISEYSLSDICEMWDMDSILAMSNLPNASCGLIFIDGEHTAERISREFPLAEYAINPNGRIILHDFKNKSVDPSYSEWISKNIIPKYRTNYILDSTLEYPGNGFLIIEPK